MIADADDEEVIGSRFHGKGSILAGERCPIAEAVASHPAAESWTAR